MERQRPTWFAAGVFVLCCLVMLADGFDNQAINYAAPWIITEFSINRALMTPVFNFGVAGSIAGAIVFGMLADRFGRRPATIGAIAMFGGFTLAIPLARDIALLSGLRFGATLGVGGGMAMAIALAGDYTPKSRRALCVTLLFLGYTVGSSGGGLLAAEIIPRFGWRSVFYAGGVGALLITGVLLLRLPESIRFLALRRPDDPRIGQIAQRLRPRVAIPPGAGFTIEQTAIGGAPVQNLFTDGRAAMTTLLWIALGFAFSTHFFLSQWLTTLLTPETGFATAARTQAMFQAGAGFSFLFGILIDRRGIPVAAMAMLAAFAPVAAIGAAAQASAWSAMACALISGILVLGGDIGMSALPVMIYPSAIRSTATGAAYGVGRVGAIFGPMLAGYLIWLDVPLATIFLVSALPVLVSGIACMALDRVVNARRPDHRESQSVLAPVPAVPNAD